MFVPQAKAQQQSERLGDSEQKSSQKRKKKEKKKPWRTVSVSEKYQLQSTESDYIHRAFHQSTRSDRKLVGP